MKQKTLLTLPLMLGVEFVAAEVSTLPLCHADPLYSEYNYGGIWERDEDGEWICNFRQFLPEDENERPIIMIETGENDFYINSKDEIPCIIEYEDE